jgi:cysteine synthase
MSQERFEWLESIAGEVIKTPGSESNVKEIFDKCWELRRSGENLVIFNQFDEFGNYLWHYEVTGPAIIEILDNIMDPQDSFRGLISATGSAGTIACGDYLKKKFPTMKIVASEALQCPTLLYNGFGAHRIEGIGDKHVPWIHNIKNTDMVVAIDDDIPMSLIRLFNEEEGKAHLISKGINRNLVESLDLLGISSVSNLVSAIKFAKYYEFGENDIVVTILTDSMELYDSRLHEMHKESGEYSPEDAVVDFAQNLQGLAIDYMEELTYYSRKRIHNLKYFTWVEQQGKTYDEIQQQWYNEHYWENIVSSVDHIDELIDEFNSRTGLLDNMNS